MLAIRPSLLLHNPERLLCLLANPQCLVQLIIASKADLADQMIYIENRPMFVRIAEAMRIRGIHHTDNRSTCAQLAWTEVKVAERCRNQPRNQLNYLS